MMLETVDGYEVGGEAGDGESAVQKASMGGFGLVLMDLQLPGINGIEATRQIRETSPHTRVLVLTSHVSAEAVREAIKAGAQGYVLKDATLEELSNALDAVTAGKSWLSQDAYDVLIRGAGSSEPDWMRSLTPQELAVLQKIAGGRSNKEAARELGLTEGTVKGYVTAVLRKMGVADRTQAAIAAVRAGITGPGQ
jgi:DNA-binding NarL/FixJ family response regulator